MLKKYWWLLVCIIVISLAIIFIFSIIHKNNEFNGNRAYQDVLYQMNLGPRIPGSEAHSKTIEWIAGSLTSAGWQVELQKAEFQGHSLVNIIATRGFARPWIILGAHYDSRLIADQDADVASQSLPVPGANDGASGVAVLLELARVIPKNIPNQISLVFFDAEDQGKIEGWDWILGSKYFVDQLKDTPDAVVIIDMIGDKDLNIFYEQNSNKNISEKIWQIAKDNGYSKQFIQQFKFSMLDDHTPFLQKGIAAIDIIDFDYPYWHTTKDTADKVSASSLKAVGQTLFEWIESQK